MKGEATISPKKIRTEIFPCKFSGQDLVLSSSCIFAEMIMRILKIWGPVFLPLIYLFFKWNTPNEKFLIALVVVFAYICIVTLLGFLVFKALTFEIAHSKSDNKY
jgi:hypothetical protein